MVIYGALLLPAVIQLGSGLGLIPVAIFARSEAEAMASVMAVTLVVGWFGSYFIGHWIGGRTRSRGILTVALVLVIGSILSKSFDFLVLSDEDFAKAVRSPDGDFQGKGVGTFLIAVFAMWVFYAIPIFLGYWMGRRSRLSKYFSYLLAVLPKDTRNLVVTLAFEEAQRLAAERVLAAPRSRAVPEAPPPLPSEASSPAPRKPQKLPTESGQSLPKKPQTLPV
jgi:hypothetical protein